MADWNQIVRANAAQVLSAAYRVTGNLADAEDVCQEVFSEAYQKWDGDSDQKWAGIFKRMSVCRAIDLLRARKPTQSLDHQAQELMDRHSSDPVDQAICTEIQHRLRTLLIRLSERESQVFCLMFFEHQTHDEIATGLGISRVAVATALSKARAKLETGFRMSSSGESK